MSFKHAIAVLIKIQFVFTGFILSFKTSLIINRFHRKLIIGARGGLIFEETYNSMYRKIGL